LCFFFEDEVVSALERFVLPVDVVPEVEIEVEEEELRGGTVVGGKEEMIEEVEEVEERSV
jgi:hypothetical protein